jgi:hypothetical protein
MFRYWVTTTGWHCTQHMSHNYARKSLMDCLIIILPPEYCLETNFAIFQLQIWCACSNLIIVRLSWKLLNLISPETLIAHSRKLLSLMMNLFRSAWTNSAYSCLQNAFFFWKVEVRLFIFQCDISSNTAGHSDITEQKCLSTVAKL